MSRSGYYDDYDGEHWDFIRWSGAVKSALRGKRGQEFLRELLAALDALPEKRLIAEALISGNGVCALGAVAIKRGVDVSGVDSENWPQLSETFGIAEAMAREIMYVNDQEDERATPERRFQIVREWGGGRIVPTAEELAE